ncbi:MAG: Methylthioribulose-1-phosphate dehydratase [Verrucomicrobia subdivision 3 bacterium]|nr:Methylthioribulose-1-phosphate dehydratase [Limisphaerales bacterium]MCS1414020.1 Methylthioribulose-1-phosphate dehydratase [Limisphaerales bacterium]
MKQIISARDVEALFEKGGSGRDLPSDAILTPSARDLLRSQDTGNRSVAGPASELTQPAAKVATQNVSALSSSAELESFFNTAEIHDLKEQICDVGRRMWQRAYVDGNGGNIAIRVADDLALCTPTLVSKGCMKPEEMCLVDLEGNQKAGVKKRTSEILMHLQIMKAQPRAKATAHCHPPHATAYAVAGVEPPTCMIPEIEVFVGKVPIAPYRTPGTPEMGKLVAELADQHNTILMGNHGAVSWSHLTVEDAYFKMEILEAYCRTVWVASQLGAPLKTMSPDQLQDLLKIKQNLGIPDPRIGLKECELCHNDEWRPGVSCAAPLKATSTATKPNADAESIVKAVTDQIMAKLNV